MNGRYALIIFSNLLIQQLLCKYLFLFYDHDQFYHHSNLHDPLRLRCVALCPTADPDVSRSVVA